MQPSSFTGALTASATTAEMLGLPSADFMSRQGSARLFLDTCASEMDFSDRFSQWTEWLDQLLARRFATSVVLVGSFAALIALLA